MNSLRVWKDNYLLNPYNFLLTIVLVLFTTTPFLQTKDAAAFLPIVPFIYTIAVIIILRIIVKNDKHFYIYASLKTLSFVLDMLVFYGIIHVFEVMIHRIDLIVRSGFVLMFILHLLREIFNAKKITADIIKGGICIYFFIGLFWAILYKLAHDIHPASFSTPFIDHLSFFYFSFTTLTTVGYGDITPVSSFARMLTNLEAIVGQLYLVIFLASLIGLHIAEKRPLK
jgi:hypothetical protein